jgi:hypothetical protein
MFNFEYLVKNEDGKFEHEEYTSAFEIANFVCRYYNDGDTPQGILNILSETGREQRFGHDDDHVWVRRLEQPLFKDKYGELKTADQLLNDKEEWDAMDQLYNGLNQERWETSERNSQVNW